MTALSPRVRVTPRHEPGQARLHIEAAGTTMVFHLDATAPRLTLGLVLGARDRPVDVSIQPWVLASAAPDAGDRLAIARWLVDLCLGQGRWAGSESDPVRAAGGGAFPLLGRAYDEGAGTLGEIPRWAASPLAAAAPRDAARAAFGVAVNRPVVVALAASLVRVDAPGAAPNLLPLALAVMGAPTLSADGVARVLRAATEAGQGPPTDWPTVEDVRRFRGLAPRLGPERATRLLVEASTVPGGVARLRRTTVLLDGIPAGTWHRLPTGLVALHDRAAALTPTDPRPVPVPVAPVRPAAGPRHTPVRARPAPPTVAPGPAPRRPAPSLPRRALAAPHATVPAPPAHAPLRYSPSAWALHGQRLDDRLRLVLPRTTMELQRWGAQLHSCIGSFGPAVASGRSLLIGVERDDVLAYCAEVTPASRTIRQLHGSHNRSVPRAVAAALGARLLASGILDGDSPENRLWVALSTSGAEGVA